MIKFNDMSDATVKAFYESLQPYIKEHSAAKVDVYRQNSGSVRIRVVDPDFQGVSMADRDQNLWPLVENLPEDVFSQLSLLLLLTPKEATDSFISRAFESS
jgi:stress-induced morphogen